MYIIARPAFSNRETNPYNFLLYSRLQGLGNVVNERISWKGLLKAKICHFHWPESFLNHESLIGSGLRAVQLILIVLLAKTMGLRLVWTVHNLKPHERRHPIMTKWFYTFFPKLCDGLIFLSQFTKEKAEEDIPSVRGIPSRVVLHGHYRDVYPASKSREIAKVELGLDPDKKLVLFFGMIRRYKNVPGLIRCFKNMNDSEWRLLVAGSVVNDASLEYEIRSIASDHQNISLDLKRISEERLHLMISASDCIVLPYSDIANSGSILLALSLNRKVVAPNKGSLSEIRDYVGEKNLYLYEGDLTSETLAVALSDRTEELDVNMSAFDWDLLAQQTHDFYIELQSCRH